MLKSAKLHRISSIIAQIQPLGAVKYITTIPVLLKDSLVLDMFTEIFTELYTLSST